MSSQVTATQPTTQRDSCLSLVPALSESLASLADDDDACPTTPPPSAIPLPHVAPASPASPASSSSLARGGFLPIHTRDYAPPKVTPAHTLYRDGKVRCPDATEFVYFPEVDDNYRMMRRRLLKQSEAGYITSNVERIEERRFPNPRFLHPFDDDPSSTRVVPIHSLDNEEATSLPTPIVIRPASPAPVETFSTAPLLGRPSSLRRNSLAAISEDSPSATSLHDDSADESEASELHRPLARATPTSSSSAQKTAPSLTSLRHRLRSIPRKPEPVTFAIPGPPKSTAVRFNSSVRVTGGVKLPRSAKSRETTKRPRSPLQKPLPPDLTCASDYVKLTLSGTTAPSHTNPLSSSEPTRHHHPTRQALRPFYSLAAPSSGQSSAATSTNSSTVSLDWPTNLHSYIPRSNGPHPDEPRRLVRPPPPPSPPKSVWTLPCEDLMFQRLLEGHDSDTDSDGDWTDDEDLRGGCGLPRCDSPMQNDEGDDHGDEGVAAKVAERAEMWAREAAWRAREDALALHDSVSAGWRHEVDDNATAGPEAAMLHGRRVELGDMESMVAEACLRRRRSRDGGSGSRTSSPGWRDFDSPRGARRRQKYPVVRDRAHGETMEDRDTGGDGKWWASLMGWAALVGKGEGRM